MEQLNAEIVVKTSNAPLISIDEAQALFDVVTPIANRKGLYAQKACIVVNDIETATELSKELTAISSDKKALLAAIKAHKDAAKARHNLWTKFEAFFVDDLDASYSAIKRHIMEYNEAQARAAEKERQRLQAIADERARREREALEKKAAAYKTEEKREAALEQASQVIAPVIQFDAPVVSVRARADIVCAVTDVVAFVKQAAIRTELCGYIDTDRLAAALKKARQSNKMFVCDGVQFTERMV